MRNNFQVTSTLFVCIQTAFRPGHLTGHRFCFTSDTPTAQERRSFRAPGTGSCIFDSANLNLPDLDAAEWRSSLISRINSRIRSSSRINSRTLPATNDSMEFSSQKFASMEFASFCVVEPVFARLIHRCQSKGLQLCTKPQGETR